MMQKDLCDAIDCNPSHISHLENGGVSISLTMLYRISVVLDQDMDRFLGGQPYTKKDTMLANTIDPVIAQFETPKLNFHLRPAKTDSGLSGRNKAVGGKGSEVIRGLVDEENILGNC